jgi:uncharacterized membrane protein YgcG
MKILNGEGRKMKGLVLAGILSMLLLSASSAAEVAFGSGSDVTSASLYPGAYGMFTASFFNMGDEPLDVNFEVEYPSDLRIEVDPPQLTMGEGVSDRPDSSGSWLILDGGQRYVKSHPVSVYVKVPSQISANRYTVKLIATAKSQQYSDGSGFAQDLIQVREITFVINVPGKVNKESSKVVRIDASSGDVIKTEAEKSFASGQGSSQSSSGGGSYSGGDSEQGTSGSSPVPSEQKQSPAQSGFGVSKDTSGNTNINLPTGKVTVSPNQADMAVDLGLVTLLISIGSLVVRILK